MRTAVMFGTALILAFGTRPAAAKVDDNRPVTLCMNVAAGIQDIAVFGARALATSIFETVGIRLLSCSGHGRFASERPIMVELATGTPPSLLPGALATTRPYEGVHIKIFYDRISEMGVDYGVTTQLLAHVLVQEIAHILQGISRHSETGIMKTGWTSADLERMRQGPLQFTPKDVELIHDGLASRTRVAANKPQ